MQVQSPTVKEDLRKRLRRVEGQVRGIQRMLEEERECHEIVQQLNAVQAAVRNANRQFMRNYARECLLSADPGEERSPVEVMDELLQMMERVQ